MRAPCFRFQHGVAVWCPPGERMAAGGLGWPASAAGPLPAACWGCPGQRPACWAPNPARARGRRGMRWPGRRPPAALISPKRAFALGPWLMGDQGRPQSAGAPFGRGPGAPEAPCMQCVWRIATHAEMHRSNAAAGASSARQWRPACCPRDVSSCQVLPGTKSKASQKATCAHAGGAPGGLRSSSESDVTGAAERRGRRCAACAPSRHVPPPGVGGGQGTSTHMHGSMPGKKTALLLPGGAPGRGACSQRNPGAHPARRATNGAPPPLGRAWGAPPWPFNVQLQERQRARRSPRVIQTGEAPPGLLGGGGKACAQDRRQACAWPGVWRRRRSAWRLRKSPGAVGEPPGSC